MRSCAIRRQPTCARRRFTKPLKLHFAAYFLARDRHRRDQLAGSPLPRSVGASSSAMCRYCCKNLFAVVIKNFPRFRRDFHVKMWGTSSSDDKLADDLGNAIEGHTNLRSSARFFYSRKLAPAN